MNKLNRRRACLASLLTFMTLLVSGCTSEFYLTESETTALSREMINEQDANNLFSPWLNQQLTLQFANPGGTPQVQSSNITPMLRLTELSLAESFSRQINLNHMGAELEKQVGNWLQNRLQVYSGAANSEVRLASLESVTVTVRSAPTFQYQPDRQTIAFDMLLNVSVRGTVRVQVNGPLGWLVGIFSGVSNGNYPLLIEINDYRLQGEAQLDSTLSDAARIKLHLTPSFTSINVAGTGSTLIPQALRNGVRQVVEQKLSEPLDDMRTQKYTYFSLPSMRLTPVVGTTPSQLQVTYQSLPELARPVLNTVARGADGKLYHARQMNGVWSNFNPITLSSPQLSFESDPALIASGTDQLELAAVTSTGLLAYAHFRSGYWSNSTTLSTGAFLPSGYQGGQVSIVASAPGQVEIVAVGRNGNLWHLRRVNGSWQAPYQFNVQFLYMAGVAPFRSPVAVQTGNKMLVVFVDAQNQMFGAAYDLETNVWSQTTQIPTQEPVRFAPAAASSGDGRVDVVYVGNNSTTPFHRRLDISYINLVGGVLTSGFSLLGSEVSIGGNATSSPKLVASGFRQLDLVVRGNDNRLWHNHLVSPDAGWVGLVDGRTIQAGWQGWDDRISSNLYGFATNSNERVENFALASTRAGQLQTIARVSPSFLNGLQPEQRLFHNSYDTTRYGRDLWKAVDWRGYQRTSTQRFLGQPALAVWDKHLELAFVGPSGTVRLSRLAESHVAQFYVSASGPTSSSPNPIDPVVLSSGPGIVDLIYLGADGAPRHLRRRNGMSTVTATLAVPPGVLLRSQIAATSYGNGYIEVVIIGQNQHLYHWRFRNGSWSAATLLNGSVLSSPILASVGAGGLELLAIGLDQKLYRWTRLNGNWTNPVQVTGNFPINAVLFGQQAASTCGDGTLDLAVVHAQTRAVYHRRLGGYENLPPIVGGPLPRTFNLLGGVVTDMPMLAAFDAANVNILVRGTDGVTWSKVSRLDGSIIARPGADPPILWNSYVPISQPGLLAGGIATFGLKDFTVIAVDAQGRLYLNSFAGWGWTGFQPMLGQSPQLQVAPPLFRPAITAHGV